MAWTFSRGAGRTVCAAALLFSGILLTSEARADDALSIAVTIKDHKFDPAEIHVPADKTVQLVISNQDSTAEEFDSKALKVEKVIAGGTKATVTLHPLAAGSYKFKGEYHEETARGVVISE